MQSIKRHIEPIRYEFVVDVIHRGYFLTTIRAWQSTNYIPDSVHPHFWILYPIQFQLTIIWCFVVTFEENELHYTKQMLQVEVKNCLRLYHTFKVASNVGYLRSDGKWITEHSSLFIVLNEKGVVAWQLTQSHLMRLNKPCPK